MSRRVAMNVIRGAELPDAEVWWLDRGRQLIDFTAATSMQLKIVRRAGEATPVLVKTVGVYGFAGSGMPESGEPNVRIVWAAGELDLAPGRYLGEITATFASGRDRRMQFDLIVDPAA